MTKRKILVTTGTRAEYGILRLVLQRIQNSKKLDLYLVVTGTHLSKKHGFTINEIKKDGFTIFSKYKMIPTQDSSYYITKALGKFIIKFSDIIKKIQPDINLILGDRDEMLASAIAAYHMNIPNAHIHGGDISGGIDEYTRHAITKISNIHFAATKKSYERIIKMGENPKYVFFTGSPSIDEIVKNKITNNQDLYEKYHLRLIGNEILLVYHPVTTQPQLSGIQIHNILKAIVKLGKTTIVLAPNSDSGNKIIFNHLNFYSKKHKFIHLFRSLPRSDYLGMLKNCGVLVGNSSSGMIDASYLQTPVVDIGIRQKGRERGKNVINIEDGSPINTLNAIKKSFKKKNQKIKKERIYGNGNASKKIVKILEEIKITKKFIQKQIHY